MKGISILLTGLMILTQTSKVNALDLFLAEIMGSEIQYVPVDRTIYDLKVLHSLSFDPIPKTVELIVNDVITTNTFEDKHVVLVIGEPEFNDPYRIVEVFPSREEQEYYWDSKVFRMLFAKQVERIFQQQNQKHQFARQGVTEVSVEFTGHTPKVLFSSRHNSHDYLIATQYYFQRVAQQFLTFIPDGVSSTFMVTTHEYQTKIREVTRPLMTHSLEQYIDRN